MRTRFLWVGLTMLLGAGRPRAAAAQRSHTSDAAPANAAQTRARDGDTVLVVLNAVRPERRADFERFVFEIFWPKAASLPAAERRVFAQMRVLRPAGPDPDGTYAYVFIADPRAPGASYDIRAYLNEMYGPQQAAAHYRLFSESLARPQSIYTVVQSRF